MPHLVIDIGNTQAKVAVFDGQQLIWFGAASEPDAGQINQLAEKYKISKGIVSSVRNNDAWQTGLSNQIKLYQFNRQMVNNINNHYRTPETLGIDRLAAVAGAVACYPGNDNFVIDAGTCITYDGVDAGNNYYGGSISPGLKMRYQAMHNYTAALPLIEPGVGFNGNYGDDTPSAMRSGVQNGLKYEVTGFVQSYYNQHPNLNVILTGGDANFLDSVLKNSIFAPYIKIEPHLVLKGLNAVIQQHND